MQTGPAKLSNEKPPMGWRQKLYEIIFEAETPAGRGFDLALLAAIVISILAISLETVESVDKHYHGLLVSIEWIMTILFSIEYILRLLCVPKPRKYASSLLGIIDLLSILPTYLSFFVGGAQSFAVIRSFRLLRIFRILKLVRFLHGATELRQAVWESRDKIVVFLTTVLVAVTIAGTMMYQLEKDQNQDQFTSIPQSMYWAVVTMTTVGYGDVVPKTAGGKILSALLILLGYSLIIVPTGFVSAEFIHRKPEHSVTTEVCPACLAEGHDADAIYCKYCGANLQDHQPES